jgi:hypothetical protein
LRNASTVFTIEMLEAPLEVTDEVEGIDYDENNCRDCSVIMWLMKNQLPVPEEMVAHRKEDLKESQSVN